MTASLRSPAALALASGVLLVLSFPDASLNLLGWVALAPLFAVCVRPLGPGRLFLYAYLTGIVFFAGSGTWIYLVMRLHGNLGVVAAAGVYAVFVLGFALFFALFGLLAGLLSGRWGQKMLFLLPFLWVTVEWARAYVPFGGFPWNLLGYAIAPYAGWTQLASITGVYGLSFIVAVVNAALVAFWLQPARRRWTGLAALTGVLAVTGWLGTRLPPEPATERAILVQTNLPQMTQPDMNWFQNNPEVFSRLEEMTVAAVTETGSPPPSLVIWPEVPVPLYFHRDPVLRARLMALAQRTGAFFLTGTVDLRPAPAARGQGEPAEEGGAVRTFYPYNSAVLVSPDGTLAGQYDKIHLVPFGEYLPLSWLLGWANPLVQEVSEFLPGDEYSVFPMGEHPVSVFICYEAIFPELVRQFVQRGATVLINVSNDGWFGRSAAAEQHLNMARIRAIETGRFLLRGTNTGITAVIDPRGRIRASAEPHTRTALLAEFGHRTGETFYVRYGDWLAALCALVAAGAVTRKYWLDAVEVKT